MARALLCAARDLSVVFGCSISTSMTDAKVYMVPYKGVPIRTSAHSGAIPGVVVPARVLSDEEVWALLQSDGAEDVQLHSAQVLRVLKKFGTEKDVKKFNKTIDRFNRKLRQDAAAQK